MNTVQSDLYFGISRVCNISATLAKSGKLKHGRTVNGVIKTMSSLGIKPFSFGERCIAVSKNDLNKILAKWKEVDGGKNATKGIHARGTVTK